MDETQINHDNGQSSKLSIKERFVRSIEDFKDLEDQEPSALNFASRWVIDKLTNSEPGNEISTGQEGWIEDLRRGLTRNARHPIDINAMRMSQFDGEKSLEGLPSITIRLNNPTSDIRDIRDDLVVTLAKKLNYSKEELIEIMDHELDHFEKAQELQVDLSGSTMKFMIYSPDYDGTERKLSLYVGMDRDIPPIKGMEICLASAKPSEPDLARFMGLLTKLDIDSVNNLDELYDVIKIYCDKTGTEFTTDTTELYRGYRGVRLVHPNEYSSLEQDSRIEVNGKNYLFRSIDQDFITVLDDYGEHKLPINDIEICVDV